jgi:Bacterial capsule synthesis protein PGA_cap
VLLVCDGDWRRFAPGSGFNLHASAVPFTRLADIWSPQRARPIAPAIGGALVAAALVTSACSSPHHDPAALSTPPTDARTGSVPGSSRPAAETPARSAAPQDAAPLLSTSGSGAPSPVSGRFTIAFAGDVHFEERTAKLLATNPATAFGASAPVLRAADLTMVNLETSISVGGRPQNKSFTFQAPATAFTALRDAGVDIATMANNHAADYGSDGLRQTLAAISASHFPVVGIGSDADAAYAPYITTVHGVRVAILAASQVQDETLANFTAGPSSAGIANAYSDRFLSAVKAARNHADVVIVYVHWGTEYQSCPNADQRSLAAALADAGASAVIGTHVHVLQGAGWLANGHYVAYGLGNYYWWRSFGNDQDDNGVLTLTVDHDKVVQALFDPSHLSDTGISPPATGTTKERILDEWNQVRGCSGLLSSPPK